MILDGDVMNEVALKYCNDWASKWSISDQDQELSNKLIDVFSRYLSNLEAQNVSKTTFRRHKSACLSLGGYIVGEVYGYETDGPFDDLDGKAILLKYIDSDGGPLIHSQEPTWQSELDAMCKKLYKLIKVEAI